MNARKKTATPAAALRFLATHQRFLVTAHVRPDGDALGAMVALTRLLNQNGKTAVFAADPSDLGAPRFLVTGEPAVRPADLATGVFDAVVCLDSGSADRIEEPLRPLLATHPVLNIDHHRTNTGFGTVAWVDGTVGSTGEMIWRLARRAGWNVDTRTAEALWVAIVTDTGRFSYDMTRPSTLRIGADLVARGARTAWINDQLFCTFSSTAIELKRRAYASLRSCCGGLAACVTLTAQDFVQTGGSKADAEDVIEIPRSLAGVRIALFFYQTPERQTVTRLSIRTREPLDATWLALRFGGGGHARAAGCDIQAPLEEARKQVCALIAAWIKTETGTPATADTQSCTCG